MDAEARLKTYADRVDARLAELLQPQQGVPEPLSRAMAYAVLGAGKRVRPALCMASARACGGNDEDALDAACALEFVHCFSLIHDDLPAIDDDDLRRGRPTVHIEYGEATAILAGDALFARAFEILAGESACPQCRSECVRVLAQASGPQGLVGGEMADIFAEGQAVSAEEVRRIHERKTAALIEASCRIGALLGGGSKEAIASLGLYGRHAGLAFQISDDLLNELSTPAAIGKSAGSDRIREKATYPSAYGVDESRRLAEQEVGAALDALNAFDGRADDLRTFARFVVDRLR